MQEESRLQKNYKTHFFYVLYTDKTWVFDLSERAKGSTYIIIMINSIANDTKIMSTALPDYGRWFDINAFHSERADVLQG